MKVLTFGQWYACEQAEREPDAFVVWHYHDCPRCAMKADVQRFVYPDDSHVRWLVGVMTESADFRTGE